MASVSISIPERLKDFVDGRIANGAFKDASEYLAALVQADARASASDRLDALLLEGIESAEQPWDAAARDAVQGLNSASTERDCANCNRSCVSTALTLRPGPATAKPCNPPPSITPA